MDLLCPDTFGHVCSWLSVIDQRVLYMTSRRCRDGVLKEVKPPDLVRVRAGGRIAAIPRMRLSAYEACVKRDLRDVENEFVEPTHSFEVMPTWFSVKDTVVSAVYSVFPHYNTQFVRFGASRDGFLDNEILWIFCKTLFKDRLIETYMSDDDAMSTEILRIYRRYCRFEVEVKYDSLMRCPALSGNMRPPPLVVTFFQRIRSESSESSSESSENGVPDLE